VKLPDTSPTVSHAIAKLRPAKIKNGVRRRAFETRHDRTPLRPGMKLVQLGTSYGGWVIPEDAVQPSWTCYCVGCGGDITFDLELIRRYGATVRAFDPVAAYVESALADADGEQRFSARQAAVVPQDGPVRMQLTHHPGSSSVSSAHLYESERYVELPGRTLASLMREHGDERIDLLKLDIEGAEYELLDTLDLPALGVQLFAAQLHHTGTVGQARSLIDRLARSGYTAVAKKSAVKLTFVSRELLARLEGASSNSPGP
jgi:FkbM family methyltransferase